MSDEPHFYWPPSVLQDNGVYNRGQAYFWWRTPNRNTKGQRPCELWATGSTEEDRQIVVAEVERLTASAHYARKCTPRRIRKRIFWTALLVLACLAFIVILLEVTTR